MVLLRSGKKTKDIDNVLEKTKIACESKFNSSQDKIIDDDLQDCSSSSYHEEDEESSDDEYDEEDEEILDWFDENYEIPKDIKEDKKLTDNFNRIVHRIKSSEPTLEDILNLKIRMKRKIYLLQKFYIYKNSFPYTEERYFLRMELMKKIQMYTLEYKDFLKHKDRYKILENSKKMDSDLMTLKSSILKLDTKKDNLKIIFQKFNLLESKMSSDDEFHKLFCWLKLCISVPFEKIKRVPCDDITSFMKFVKSEMDKELYGMTEVKEKILLYIHNRILNPKSHGFPLALIGAPGIGKTSIAILISKVMSIPFHQISMGGITNPEFLLGFDSCYVGSKPGRISEALIQMQYKNGCLFFDEFDKISQNKDIVSAMLHITDSTQNNNFHDNYFADISIDLSNCWIITSMNSKPENKALDDRMAYVYLSEYDEKDKIQIVKNYLIPKSLQNLNLSTSSFEITNETIQYLVRKISPEQSGIRMLKQKLSELFSKLIFLITNPDIQTSFNLPAKYASKMKYPFTIETDVIDMILKKNSKEGIPTSIQYMYV